MKLILTYISVAAIYVLLAKLGLELASLHSNVSPVWPPTGFAISVLLILGKKFWPCISLGAFIANYTTDVGFLPSLLIMLGNTLEAVIAFKIINSVNQTDSYIAGFEKPLKIVVGSVFGSVVAATIGSSALVIFSNNPSFLKDIAYTWFIGDLIGALVLVPLALKLRNAIQNKSPEIYRQIISAAILAASSVYFIFISQIGHNLPFLILPVILVARVLTGSLGMQFFVLFISFGAIWATSSGYGPFIHGTNNLNLGLLQLFMIAACISAIGLSYIPNFKSLRLASTVLLGGWILSSFVYYSFEKEASQADKQEFDHLIQNIEAKFENRMRIYTEALYSGASLYAASSEVEPEEWRDFVSSLKLTERYPGINGMGVIIPVNQNTLPEYLDWCRKEIDPDYKIKTVPQDTEESVNEKFVITYIEPLAGNLPARGLDVASEKNRRAAARRARETGQAAMTERIVLVQDSKQGAGFLLFVPVYRKNSDLSDTERRIKNLQAWIYAPFISRDFFEGANIKWSESAKLKVYESDDLNDSNLIFVSAGWKNDAVEKITRINLAGNELILAWSRSEAVSNDSHTIAIWVGVSSALASLFLSGIVASLSLMQKRADEMVQLKTAELQRSQQRAIELAQEACIATASKSTFLATMSHEIRTPLNGIVGMTDLILGTKITEEQKEYIATVKSCSESLLTIINDILDFSKIEAGKMQISRDRVNIRELINGITDLLSVKISEKQLELTVFIDPNLSQHVWGDKTRIGQVLINLIGNAIKFTDHQGFIKISVNVIKDQNQTEMLQFCIEDNGIGIPEDKQKNIFDPFTQADISTTKKFGGTGLGLTICRQLLELMSGRIWMESRENTGSSFYFSIPCNPVPETEMDLHDHEVSRIIPEQNRSLNILIAEDNLVNQKLMLKMLEKKGHKVTIAANGQEAVDLIVGNNKKISYDLVLMDCLMPVLNGFEATRLLRNNPSAEIKSIPIIALTANAQSEDREDCLRAGMNDYIAKPFQLNDLIDKINYWAEPRSIQTDNKNNNL